MAVEVVGGGHLLDFGAELAPGSDIRMRWIVFNAEMFRSEKIRIEWSLAGHVEIRFGHSASEHLSNEFLQQRFAAIPSAGQN